ncbi:unnamed protein product [Haemonchus placei]|uniref:CKLF like MARVEL transmembrane domain containing 2 n=1 Tax=Haemonchus placei TaxID=6290 RepID=A0A0N4W765_HAEPC|nr:unnamed protein product [Haemonchus placei]
MTPDLDTELQPGEEKSKPQRASPPEKHPGEEKSKGQRPSPPDKSDIKEADQVFDKDEEKNLKQFDFYHGFLPREDLYILVKYVGDYLLRVSEVILCAIVYYVETTSRLLRVHVDYELTSDNMPPAK